MRHLLVVLIIILAALLQGCVVRDDGRWPRCSGAHRLRIVDLDMSPDPIAEGQRVALWRVTLNADASGECATQLQIRESPGNDLVASEWVYRLRPGRNEIRFEPDGRYRFSRREHCFQVMANIEGTARAVDASRRFCAREVGGRRWSLAP